MQYLPAKEYPLLMHVDWHIKGVMLGEEYEYDESNLGDPESL